MLKQAIKNSERKKYHGDFETTHFMPDSGIQLKKLLSKYRPIEKIFSINTEKTEKDYKVAIK